MNRSSLLTRRDLLQALAISAVASQLDRSLLAARKKPTSREQFDGPESLRAHAESVGLLVGCAVVPELLRVAGDRADSGCYTQTVAAQTNIVVAENAMKWASLRPTPSTYEFGLSDRLFQFAAERAQQVRGHNLCWHEQLPKWFQGFANKENAKSLLQDHIATVASRYAGRVHSWDVVNEAIHLPDGRPDGLRKSPWLELIGPEYIEIAFLAAAKADPQAKLTYNDYDIELDTAEQAAKRGAVLMLIRRLHARGVPIQALGIQSHLQATGLRSAAGLVSLIREAAKMGLEVYVTELDVNTHKLEGGDREQDAAVAAVYSDYLTRILSEPNVKALLTWGVTDGRSWLNQIQAERTHRADGARQRPLPFDDRCMPTAAFFAMRDAIDASRRATPQTAQPGKDSFAPFAVPGSPSASPQIPVEPK